jgi:ATP-dependent DNA helicase RecG
LALASFGDLDVSTLRELPARRGAVDTRIVAGAAARQRAYRSLRAQLEAGRQGYIVCPLVSEPGATGSRCDAAAPAGAQDAAGDTLYAAGDLGPSAPCELRAAEAELRRLRASELDGFGVVLLHGQMPARERRAVMSAFVAGEAHVLVSTTVIEVGIDVPNATVMIVENAERFGISQLHQLRGRIGRGEHRSECSLMTPSRTRSSPRLRALAETSDGFKLAELDLQLRGRGELAGMRQSGPASFRVARLPEDATLLENARSYAEAIIARDPELRAPEHALLQGALAENFGAEALAPIRA